MAEISELDNNNFVSKVEGTKSPANLQAAAAGLCAQRLTHLEKKANEELNQVKKRQVRMRFVNNSLRFLNGIANEKGETINLETNEDMKKMIAEIDKMGEAASSLESEAAQLDAETAQLDPSNPSEKTQIATKTSTSQAKREEAAEFKDIAEAAKMLKGKKSLTREEKDKLIENFKSAFDDFSSVNQMQTQSINRLNNERHEAIMMARLIMKTLHDSIVRMAHAVSGRG